MNLSKPLLGIGAGATLGLVDGLSAFAYPEAAPMMAQIVIGSTVKGIITGAVMGLVSRRLRSVPLGVGIGLALGLGLSFLAASAPNPSGERWPLAHYFEVMIPGGLVGLIVGYATQRYGRSPGPSVSDAPR